MSAGESWLSLETARNLKHAPTALPSGAQWQRRRALARGAQRLVILATTKRLWEIHAKVRSATQATREQLTEVDAAALLVSVVCHSFVTAMTERDEGLYRMDEREWLAQRFEAHRTHHRLRKA